MGRVSHTPFASPAEPTPDAAIAEIKAELALMDGTFGPYELVLDWAKAMPPLPAALHRDEFLVPGCQSKVWLVPSEAEGKLWFRGDSDAPIVRGLVAMMLRMSGIPFEIVYSMDAVRNRYPIRPSSEAIT